MGDRRTSSSQALACRGCRLPALPSAALEVYLVMAETLLEAPPGQPYHCVFSSPWVKRIAVLAERVSDRRRRIVADRSVWTPARSLPTPPMCQQH